MTRKAFFLILWSVMLWALAILLEIDVFYMLSALGVGTLLLSALLVNIDGRHLAVERSIRPRIRQGSEIKASLVLTCRRGWGVGPLLLKDTNPACGDKGAPVIWLSGLPAGDEVELTYESPAAVRGDHELGPVEVIVSDPLGVFRRRRRLSCPGRLVVQPAWEVMSLLPVNGHLRSHLVGAGRHSSEGEGEDFYGVREYRYGDTMQRVHWPLTARYQQPMVRQFENETRPGITLFTDTFPVSDSRSQATQLLDRCTAVSASIAVHVLERSSRVSCVAPDTSLRVFGVQPGASQREALLHFFALLVPDARTSRAKALSQTMNLLRGGETLIVVMSDIDSVSVATLAAYSHGGGDVVVFLIHSAEGLPSSGSPTREHELLAEDRATCIERLRGLGVAVVPVGRNDKLDVVIRAWLR